MSRPNHTGKVLTAIVAVLLTGGALAVNKMPPAVARAPRSVSTEGRDNRVERGRYLVTILGCNDCHTPWKVGPNGPEPDMSRMLSGHPQQIGSIRPPSNAAELNGVRGGWLAASNATNTAFSGPWGTTYTANLTPDRLTGIGIWTEEQFVNALRTGTHWGAGPGKSRPIMPPMPWQGYGRMNDDDMKAVWAYLRSIPPVSNQVPDYKPLQKTN